MVVHDTFCIIDNNGCKDNTKHNNILYHPEPYNIQQNMTTTAGKTTQHKTKQLVLCLTLGKGSFEKKKIIVNFHNWRRGQDNFFLFSQLFFFIFF